MSCKRCSSNRVAGISGKTSDLFYMRIGDKEHNGYVLSGFGIGQGDYIDFNYCLNCGQIQHKFPIPEDNELEGGEAS